MSIQQEFIYLFHIGNFCFFGKSYDPIAVLSLMQDIYSGPSYKQYDFYSLTSIQQPKCSYKKDLFFRAGCSAGGCVCVCVCFFFVIFFSCASFCSS